MFHKIHPSNSTFQIWLALTLVSSHLKKRPDLDWVKLNCWTHLNSGGLLLFGRGLFREGDPETGYIEVQNHGHNYAHSY